MVGSAACADDVLPKCPNMPVLFQAYNVYKVASWTSWRGSSVGRIVMMYIVVKVRGEDNNSTAPPPSVLYLDTSANASLLAGRLMGCDKRATLFATSCLLALMGTSRRLAFLSSFNPNESAPIPISNLN